MQKHDEIDRWNEDMTRIQDEMLTADSQAAFQDLNGRMNELIDNIARAQMDIDSQGSLLATLADERMTFQTMLDAEQAVRDEADAMAWAETYEQSKTDQADFKSQYDAQKTSFDTQKTTFDAMNPD